MSLHGSVSGGTGAGRKRPLEERPNTPTWHCRCLEGGVTRHYRLNPAYLTRCPDCREVRPCRTS